MAIQVKRALLVVARRPIEGVTKTRLSPPLSPQQASQLYEGFLLDTLDLARAVSGVTRLIAFAPVGEAAYFRRLAPDFYLLPQEGATLGERLDNALTRCLRDGFDQAVAMDSDSPTLPVQYVASAFTELDDAEVVLGPCDDGGYYLIGLTSPRPQLLRGVKMSTPDVLRDTLALAERDGLRVSLLPPWFDVDTVEDLRRLRDELGALPDHALSHTRRFLRTSTPRYA